MKVRKGLQEWQVVGLWWEEVFDLSRGGHRIHRSHDGRLQLQCGHVVSVAVRVVGRGLGGEAGGAARLGRGQVQTPK